MFEDEKTLDDDNGVCFTSDVSDGSTEAVDEIISLVENISDSENCGDEESISLKELVRDETVLLNSKSLLDDAIKVEEVIGDDDMISELVRASVILDVENPVDEDCIALDGLREMLVSILPLVSAILWLEENTSELGCKSKLLDPLCVDADMLDWYSLEEDAGKLDISVYEFGISV